ncbi:MAG: Sapep family Mn(2+)-dependent dipeptidase [Clostridia bacterium]|nr:Sapep family Mn(2+)-dependent dipeptidase [Clostridia bacterium]
METYENNIIKEIKKYFDNSRESMIRDICDLINIKSVREAAIPAMPFGEGPAKALKKGLEIAEKLGAITFNAENYCGIADFKTPDGDTAPEVGILVHMDVVPEGTYWTYPPYEATVTDAKIFGRGAADDKGPAVAALYAAKAAVDITGGLKKSLRIILGCCEETGTEDMDYYKDHFKMPVNTFSPDADFPIINIEKGRYAPTFSKTFPKGRDLSVINKNLQIITFNGGETQNIVPQEASCRIIFKDRFSDEIIEKIVEKSEFYTEVNFYVEKADDESDEYTIKAKGKSAHAANPEKGNNAQTALLCLLVDLYNRHKSNICAENNCAECQMCNDDNFFKYAGTLLKLFPHGQTDGKNIGIDYRDSLSGALTLNFGVLKYKNNVLTGGIDIRIPLAEDYAEIKKAVDESLYNNGFTVDDACLTLPHHTDANSPFVQTLLKSYSDITGNEAKCMSTGGGTYVHDIPGGVAFGCTMPGTDNRMHESDEFIIIDDIIKSAEIFTLAIIRLCS